MSKHTAVRLCILLLALAAILAWLQSTATDEASAADESRHHIPADLGDAGGDALNGSRLPSGGSRNEASESSQPSDFPNVVVMIDFTFQREKAEDISVEKAEYLSKAEGVGRTRWQKSRAYRETGNSLGLLSGEPWPRRFLIQAPGTIPTSIYIDSDGDGYHVRQEASCLARHGFQECWFPIVRVPPYPQRYIAQAPPQSVATAAPVSVTLARAVNVGFRFVNEEGRSLPIPALDAIVVVQGEWIEGRTALATLLCPSTESWQTDNDKGIKDAAKWLRLPENLSFTLRASVQVHSSQKERVSADLEVPREPQVVYEILLRGLDIYTFEVADSRNLPVPEARIVLAGETQGDPAKSVHTIAHTSNKGIAEVAFRGRPASVQVFKHGYQPHIAEVSVASAYIRISLAPTEESLRIHVVWQTGLQPPADLKFSYSRSPIEIKGVPSRYEFSVQASSSDVVEVPWYGGGSYTPLSDQWCFTPATLYFSKMQAKPPVEAVINAIPAAVLELQIRPESAASPTPGVVLSRVSVRLQSRSGDTVIASYNDRIIQKSRYQGEIVAIGAIEPGEYSLLVSGIIGDVSTQSDSAMQMLDGFNERVALNLVPGRNQVLIPVTGTGKIDKYSVHFQKPLSATLDTVALIAGPPVCYDIDTFLRANGEALSYEAKYLASMYPSDTPPSDLAATYAALRTNGGGAKIRPIIRDRGEGPWTTLSKSDLSNLHAFDVATARWLKVSVDEQSMALTVSERDDIGVLTVLCDPLVSDGTRVYLKPVIADVKVPIMDTREVSLPIVSGKCEFRGLFPGTYRIVIGQKTGGVSVSDETSPSNENEIALSVGLRATAVVAKGATTTVALGFDQPADDKPKDDGITGKRGGEAGEKQEE